LLDGSQIASRNIVQYSQRQQNARSQAPTSAPLSFGARDSSYDATVGTIISNGTQEGSTYTLPPRGVIWVVSEEEFHLPDNVTALAALRTTWAHKGIFALNVGVVDPGWKGPVATALVNFSTEDFKVSHDDPFMRLVFFEHAVTHPTAAAPSAANYLRQVKKNSRDFSKSFLNMEALVDDVSRKIFAMPKLGIVAAWIAIIVAFFATILPIAYSLVTGIYDDRVSMIKIEQRIEALEKKSLKENEISQQGGSTSGARRGNGAGTMQPGSNKSGK
jgi:deoxycytidine triphosphate deaminase